MELPGRRGLTQDADLGSPGLDRRQRQGLASVSMATHSLILVTTDPFPPLPQWGGVCRPLLGRSVPSPPTELLGRTSLAYIYINLHNC